jgi:D-xylose transport system permease protein
MADVTAQPPGPAAATPASEPETPQEILKAAFDPREWITRGGGRSLPILAALVIMWIVFDIWSSGVFLSGQDVANILIQTTEFGVVSIGIVVVLLLGEIDLSLGSLVVLCGPASALIMNEWVPTEPDLVRAIVGVAASLIIGALCGFFQGFWVAVMRIPSFVVTLAGLLVFYGISLIITNSLTTIITSSFFKALGGASDDTTVLNGGLLPVMIGRGTDVFHLSAGMLVGVAVGLIYLASLLLRRRDRLANGLSAKPLTLIIGQTLGLTLVGVALADLLDHFYGVPIPVVIMLVFLMGFAYVLGRTRFGRHIYATGGNAEAARRAGIPIQRIRWAAFVISGTMAGAGAVIIAARPYATSTGSVGSDFLLDVIAAAVIGGTSLFGGRGTVWSALLGALVLSTIVYGMGLTLVAGSSNGTYYEYVVEGAILLIAVMIDTFATGSGPRLALPSSWFGVRPRGRGAGESG